MATLNSIDEVLYECSCGEWISVNRLYFCRQCSALRCDLCVSQEMDIPFCPSCFDNFALGEAVQRRNRCPNCYQCPLCGVAVVVRSANDLYHLSCNTCRWTTKDAHLPDMTSAKVWPEYDHEDKDFLNSILESLRAQATIERADRDRLKYTKRRSNLGPLSNRFGLQRLYDRHKAAVISEQHAKPSVPVLVATHVVPQLDESVFSEVGVDTGSIPTLSQRLGQILSNDRVLLPLHTHLMCRRSVRCRQCDHSLCKGDYSPSSIKLRLQVLAGNYVPEIHLSRPATLVAGHSCPVYLTISNYSASTAHIIVMGDDSDDPSLLKCETLKVEFALPNRDERIEFDSVAAKQPAETNEIVFRKLHRVGIRIMVAATEGHKKFLNIIMKYTHNHVSFDTTGEKKWLQHRVRISLGDSPVLNET